MTRKKSPSSFLQNIDKWETFMQEILMRHSKNIKNEEEEASFMHYITTIPSTNDEDENSQTGVNIQVWLFKNAKLLDLDWGFPAQGDDHQSILILTASDSNYSSMENNESESSGVTTKSCEIRNTKKSIPFIEINHSNNKLNIGGLSKELTQDKLYEWIEKKDLENVFKTPMDIHLARELLSYHMEYLLESEGSRHQNETIIPICIAHDPFNENRPCLLSIQKLNETQFVITDLSQGKMKGSSIKECVKETFGQRLSKEEMLHSFAQKQTVQSEFNILEASKLTERDKSSSISVHAEYTTNSMENILVSKERYDVQYHLNILYVNGFVDSENHEATQYIRNQLKRLAYLSAAIIDDTKLNDMENTVSLNDLEERIQNFLEDQVILNKSKEYDSHVVEKKICRRTNLDFTEALWEALIDVGNINDIQYFVSAVFEELKSGILKPAINKTNKTGLASVVRDLLMTRGSLGGQDEEALIETLEYWSSESVPLLECLTDIGFYKVQRDLSQALLNQQLVSWNEIESLLDYHTASEKLFALHVLERTVELLTLFQTYLVQAPETMIRSILRGFISYLKETKNDHDEDLEGDGTINDNTILYKSIPNNAFFVQYNVPKYVDELSEYFQSLSMSFPPDTIIVSPYSQVKKEHRLSQAMNSTVLERSNHHYSLMLTKKNIIPYNHDPFDDPQEVDEKYNVCLQYFLKFGDQ